MTDYQLLELSQGLQVVLQTGLGSQVGWQVGLHAGLHAGLHGLAQGSHFLGAHGSQQSQQLQPCKQTSINAPAMIALIFLKEFFIVFNKFGLIIFDQVSYNQLHAASAGIANWLRGFARITNWFAHWLACWFTNWFTWFWAWITGSVPAVITAL